MVAGISTDQNMIEDDSSTLTAGVNGGQLDAPVFILSFLIPFPLDKRTVKKIKHIIRTQFDVEIENKKRDVRLIDFRLAECEDLLERLRDAWKNRTVSFVLQA